MTGASEGLALALATAGLGWVIAAAVAAGIVYGFAGFGAALIFMPVAARVLPPETAVGAFAVAALASAATMLPRIWPQVDRARTGWMVLAALATLPVGLAILARAPEAPLRWAICLTVATTLAAVASGWTLRLPPGPVPRLGLGAAAGLCGGATGLLGPVVILTTLASGEAAASMRANLTAFLTITSVLMLPVMGLRGLLPPHAIWLGLLLLPAYGVATLVGAALFRPGAERLYRRLAYAVVAASVLLGLPIRG